MEKLQLSTNNTTFIPKAEIDKIFTDLRNKNVIFSEQLVNVIDGVEREARIGNINIGGNIIQPYSSTFNPSGLIVFGDNLLQTSKLMVNEEYSKDEIETLFITARIPGVDRNDLDFELSSVASETLFVALNSKLSDEIARNIIIGDTARSGATESNKINGFLKLLSSNTGTTKITAISITVDNVFDELDKTFDALPTEVQERRGTGEIISWVSFDTHSKMRRAFRKLGGATEFTKEIVNYDGVKLVAVPGLVGSQMITYHQDNFWVGVQAPKDEESWLSGRKNSHDDKFFYRCNFKLGTAMYRANYAVLHL